jgi:hypothetical protein
MPVYVRILYVNSLTDTGTDTEAQEKKKKRDAPILNLFSLPTNLLRSSHFTSALLFPVKDDSGLVSAAA